MVILFQSFLKSFSSKGKLRKVRDSFQTQKQPLITYVRVLPHFEKFTPQTLEKGLCSYNII